jgi:maltooligosyltrehalose trehalohydrolase
VSSLVSEMLQSGDVLPAAPITCGVPALGAHRDGDAVTFRVYATAAKRVVAAIEDEGGKVLRTIELAPRRDLATVFETRVSDIRRDALYTFWLDGRRLPDPYARWMPQGVHGPAVVTDPSYLWKHPPRPRPLGETVFYELHVGTFTPEGTYRAAQEHLPDLAQLGVTTIELLPIAAFPGRRGWGYDGVAPFAPYPPYGTPHDLRAFVDEAHALGLSVVLDVVYNHFGPDGNYLPAYSPEYFTDRIPTPWGAAPNFDNLFMRSLVRASAHHWLVDYRFDGLRLDATHALVDTSPRHILRELADDAAALSPARLLVAEDERNLPSIVTSLGMNGVWADDFHHAVHVLSTGERDGYYAGFGPSVEDLARTIERGWLYDGRPWPLTGRPRGEPATLLPAPSFIYSVQNHDQVGNRALGDRIFAGTQGGRLAAVTMLLLFLPATPLLFMGQEWGASTPFLFFSDHEPCLGAKVTAGRRAEFRQFASFGGVGAGLEVPDPQAEETFLRSKLSWSERESPAGRDVLGVVRRMLELRRTDAVMASTERETLAAAAVGALLVVTRAGPSAASTGARRPGRVLLVNFADVAARVPESIVAEGSELLIASETGVWRKRTLGPRGAVLLAGGVDPPRGAP